MKGRPMTRMHQCVCRHRKDSQLFDAVPGAPVPQSRMRWLSKVGIINVIDMAGSKIDSGLFSSRISSCGHRANSYRRFVFVQISKEIHRIGGRAQWTKWVVDIDRDCLIYMHPCI
jgi:hypothetical protein